MPLRRAEARGNAVADSDKKYGSFCPRSLKRLPVNRRPSWARAFRQIEKEIQIKERGRYQDSADRQNAFKSPRLASGNRLPAELNCLITHVRFSVAGNSRQIGP
jgi:hypothetical protein